MKMSKKISENLKRRRNEYVANDSGTKMPGSQNRKKGYGISRGGR